MPAMRKFVCEKLTRVEALPGERLLIVCERICLETSLETGLEMAAQCASRAAEILKTRQKPRR